MTQHTASQRVQQQYERFPYPPLPWPALPRRGQGQSLRYETGLALAGMEPASHRGKRILVAGCGTLEPLVVAENHPRAECVVAVDLSRASLRRLGKRLRWARLRNVYTLAGLRGWRLPPVELRQADLNDYRAEPFDYILASNVLHHVYAPAALLQHLASLLKPGGLMRVVTYPKHSRYWLRQTSAWLRLCGLSPQTPGLKRAARQCVQRLPPSHPIRNCFHSHSETRHAAGLVDAFLHSLENPLSPLEWRAAAGQAGLALIAEAQRADSRSTFLAQLAPETESLDIWTRSQILDDLLELSTNPVWWFRKEETTDGVTAPIVEDCAPPGTPTPAAWSLCRGVEPTAVARAIHEFPAGSWRLPSRCYADLGMALHEAERLLRPVHLDIERLIERLRHEVGPHLDGRGRLLGGLSVGEYDTPSLMKAMPPWSTSDWRALDNHLDRNCRIMLGGKPVPGDSLAKQAQWLQLRYGPESPMIEDIRFLRSG